MSFKVYKDCYKKDLASNKNKLKVCLLTFLEVRTVFKNNISIHNDILNQKTLSRAFVYSSAVAFFIISLLNHISIC